MSPKSLQIFVKSPELDLPTQTLTLIPSPSQTIDHLKLSLLPNNPLSSFYFTLDGKPLNGSTLLAHSRIAPFSTLILRPRLLGGGGDGGATGAESRDCYLKMYAEKKPDKVDPNEQRLSKWLNCALSYEPLREPCVVDYLGNVFNKEALVEALLGKKLPKEFGHVKGLKDMIKIQLSLIPGSELDHISDKEKARFQCPISGFEFNGKYKFFALKTCGHVLSAKALKEVKSSSCLVCHKEFTEMDKIVINGSEEEVAVLRERLEQEKAKLREKKAKKVKHGAVAVNGEEAVELPRLSGMKHKHGVDVKAVEKVSGKLDVNGKVGNVGVPLTGATDVSAKRLKTILPVPANATKEVYSSIFNSSRKSGFKETYSCRSLPLGRN